MKQASGNTGLDGTDLLPLPRSAPNTTTPALVAIRDALLKQPTGSAWVVATGALTNVGLLFAAFPELVPHIAGLSIMGGAVGGGFTDAPMGKVKGEGPRIGNITPWAEFNIYVSFHAGLRLEAIRVVSHESHLTYTLSSWIAQVVSKADLD